MGAYIGRVGSQIVVPHRGDEYYCGHLKVMGDLGQINFQVGTLQIIGSIYELFVTAVLSN